MNVFMREMSRYIIYTTIKHANEIQKFNSHAIWMIMYAIRKFQAIRKKDVCKICQDIINIIFTSQGEAINNDMVLNWLKTKKQFHNSTTPVAVVTQKRQI